MIQKPTELSVGDLTDAGGTQNNTDTLHILRSIYISVYFVYDSIFVYPALNKHFIDSRVFFSFHTHQNHNPTTLVEAARTTTSPTTTGVAD